MGFALTNVQRRQLKCIKKIRPIRLMRSMRLIPMTGAQASVEAMRQMKPAVFPAYPITPQTPIIEGFAELVASGKVMTEFIAVESEHSALSAAIGAEVMGVRAFTATSSQGLMLMSEILSVASGLRLPILMNVAARAISAPINIHCDHSDVMNVSGLGWLQFFAENPQEVYDLNFIALKTAEGINTPAMVIQDGFVTSHSVELLETVPDGKISAFVGEYKPEISLLNFDEPKTVGPLVLPDYFMEVKKAQINDFDRALETFKEIFLEYSKLSGRVLNTLDEDYLEGSENAIVCLGSTAGTVKHYLKSNPDCNFSMIKIVSFRPFDYSGLAKILKKYRKVVVLERAPTYGATGFLTQEIYASLRLLKEQKEVKTFVYGLGGANFGLDDLSEIFKNS